MTRSPLGAGADARPADVGINAVSGQFKAAPLPMADTPITAAGVLRAAAALAPGPDARRRLQAVQPDFGAELVDALKAHGHAGRPAAEAGDAAQAGFGVGWWKHDPAEAEKLLASVGMKKGADGFYTMPDGTPWSSSS